MMPSHTDYEVVTSFLNSLSIHYSRDWVSKSIDRVKSLNSFASSTDLCNAVYQNWLHLDLRELKIASLPANLLSREKFTLTGKYAVQVESMVNSAKSSYSELRIIQEANKNTEIVEEVNEAGETVAESKRCLTFVLCDGVQEIQGMEYENIPSFRLKDPNILPGIKILIIGPVICRKGMLLLKKENVKICGGKVESLCQTNNLELLLCRKLGLDSNLRESDPNQRAAMEDNINSDLFSSSASQVQEEIVHNSCSKSDINNVISNDESIELLPESDDYLVALSLESNSFDNEFNENSSREITDNASAGADFIMKQKINTRINTRQVHENNGSEFLNAKSISNVNKKNHREEEILYSGKNKKARLNEKFLCENNDLGNNIVCDEAFNNDNSNELIFKSVLSASRGCGDSVKLKRDVKRNNQMKVSSYLTNTGTENLKVDNPQEKGGKKLPQVVSSYPFIYLRQTAHILLTEPTIFVVKAIILTLKSKISIKDDEFALKAIISDGSYAVQVNFSSEILENILEYSPCEITSFMAEKIKNLAICERLKAIFFSAQQKLLSMNCLMEIKFFNEGCTPLVIGLEEIQLKHINALKERIL